MGEAAGRDREPGRLHRAQPRRAIEAALRARAGGVRDRDDPERRADAWLSVRDEPAEKPPVTPDAPASDSGYTDDEEAEVRKRLEDLGYVE